MSANESRAAVARLASKRESLGAEDFGAYAFLVLGILAYEAPEVVQFVLDSADERMTTPPGTPIGGDDS